MTQKVRPGEIDGLRFFNPLVSTTLRLTPIRTWRCFPSSVALSTPEE